MKFFNKIKEKMCMSKTSAVLGFRVTLRLVSLNLSKYFGCLYVSLLVIMMVARTNSQV